MNNRERKEYEDQFDEQQNYSEEDDDVINRDLQNKDNKRYPSDVLPQDFYPWKKFRSDPDAKADFPGLVDKDVTFANFKGELPNLQEMAFKSQTIRMFQGHFVDRALTPEDARDFGEVVDYLLVEFKFSTVASRAHGDNREAMLDSQTNIRKDLVRKNEQKGSVFGLGR